MKYLVATHFVEDAVGHAVMVDAESPEEAVGKGQHELVEAQTDEMVCGHCDQEFPIPLLVVQLSPDVWYFEPGERGWVLQDRTIPE